MTWATAHITKLQIGETVRFRPHGNSMTPRIYSGDLCTVAPVDPTTLERGDVVLCRVNGSDYLHLVNAVQGEMFQIANNHGHINGSIRADKIYGKLICVSR